MTVFAFARTTPAERLATAGQPEYASAMLSFTAAVQRVKVDSLAPGSRDFRAIEVWAGMLFSRGHWANYVRDTTADARFRYLGALAHYNLSPPAGPRATARHSRQVWVGPRALVSVDGDDGFVSDEIPATRLGCPVGWAEWLQPGQHVTAMGSDAEHKNEIAPAIITGAGLYVADSLKQTRRLGELHHAIAARLVTEGTLFPELGEIIAGRKPGRTAPEQITVADLTGTGIQDTAIATLAAARAAATDAGTTFES